MYESRSIPSLEELEQMERRQSQAIEALEYIVSESDSGSQAVKCQRCSIAVPIVGKMSRPKNDTVVKLQTRQRFKINYFWYNNRTSHIIRRYGEVTL
jgi:hypothetical protein